MSMMSVMPSSHLILCHPLLLLPSIFPSIRLFSNELALQSCGQVAKVLELQLQHQSYEYSGLTSFRIVGLILLSKGLSRLFSSTTTRKHQFFMVQLSHPYMTTRKKHDFDYMDLCQKSDVCFLIHCLGLSYLSFQEASVFQFHGCSHCPQWFWSPRKENLSPFSRFLSICHEVMGLDAMILVFWMSFKPAF